MPYCMRFGRGSASRPIEPDQVDAIIKQTTALGRPKSATHTTFVPTDDLRLSACLTNVLAIVAPPETTTENVLNGR